MFFEGSEKKIEVIVPSHKKLRDYPFSFWEKLIKKSKARILNHFSNSQMQAFLLSESSLFVWDSRVTLITCGQTTLKDATLYLLKKLGIKDIQALFFQRKNELFPLNQKTNFDYDVQRLRKKISGSAYRFGPIDSHHFFLFHLNKEYSPHPSDKTIELLMYSFQDPIRRLFSEEGVAIEKIREVLHLKECFPSFTIQDHLFKPQGYSLNALRGDEYYTIHVTPQKVGFYVSFETNMKEDFSSIVNKVILLFRPARFDVITFVPTHSDAKLVESVDGFVRNYFYKKSLSCGFDVDFTTFQVVQDVAKLPYSF